MKEKIYEAPLTEEIEIIVEQAVLAASGGSVGGYPGYSDEQNLGW